MAEAHSAVGFQFKITHEGLDVDFDWEVLRIIWRSGVRSWKKRVARFKNSCKCGIYPAPLSSLGVCISVLTGLYLTGIDILYGLTTYSCFFMPGPWLIATLLGCCFSGLFLWVFVILTLRYSLRIILLYKGWMYEERGKGKRMSIWTKGFLLLVKVLSSFSDPMLYSFQASLPRLPMPSLKNTIRRYLRGVESLCTPEEYENIKEIAKEFQSGIGRKLQLYLMLKAWWSTNYVSDWWEEYVYLRGRSPLMVNSNFYGIEPILIHPTKVQAARAANVVYGCLQFRRLIDRQELKPLRLQGLIPLCSAQYERLFNTTRIAQEETDQLLHLTDSRHIVVYHRGKFFKMMIHARGRILRPCELERQFEAIIENHDVPAPGEEKLGALTAADRNVWGSTRKEFFSHGVNKISLTAIETAAFVVSLDDCDYIVEEKTHEKLDEFARSLLHGRGYDRWFDKSFTVIVGRNGRVGFNAEHSWGDAPILGHLFEYCFALDVFDLGYEEDGHTKGTPEFYPPMPTRLKWEIAPKCMEIIQFCYGSAQAILKDVDLRIMKHDAYGKGFMKKCQMSPDAYIQMALQLAYYRDAGKFNLTYEASMTRLFREGRTETVRPCTMDSSRFVRAMQNPHATDEERIALLNKAVKTHQRAYQNCMLGKGIDRHLFCLYVISRYLEIDSPFLEQVLSEPWRLSTSQTPQGQTARMDANKHPECISAGGGFGPVADDGYGVSYMIAGENIIFFHISSKVSSPDTDTNRFENHIKQAFQDLHDLFVNSGRVKDDAVIKPTATSVNEKNDIAKMNGK